MKIPSPVFVCSGLLGLLCLSGRAEIPMEVSIRSGIDSTEKMKRDHDPRYDADRTRHARVYVLASVREVKDEAGDATFRRRYAQLEPGRCVGETQGLLP